MLVQRWLCTIPVMIQCFISTKLNSSQLCISAVPGIDLMLRCTCEPALSRREGGATSLITLPQTSLSHANIDAPSAKLILVAPSSLSPMIWQIIDLYGLQLRYLHMPLWVLNAFLQSIWSQNYTGKGCTGIECLPTLKSVLYVFHFRILSGSLGNRPVFQRTSLKKLSTPSELLRCFESDWEPRL